MFSFSLPEILKMHFRWVILLSVNFLISIKLNAQENLRFKTSGGFTGYGYELNPGITYRVLYMAGDFSFPLGKKEKKNFFSWYLEPQFNFVKTERTDIEFGTNIGIRHHIKLGQRSWFYQMLGSGPHFISAELERQATGFIFSDNLAIGLLRQMKKDKPLLLNIQLRYRHISNASLKKPNSGIDNINLILGFSCLKY